MSCISNSCVSTAALEARSITAIGNLKSPQDLDFVLKDHVSLFIVTFAIRIILIPCISKILYN